MVHYSPTHINPIGRGFYIKELKIIQIGSISESRDPLQPHDLIRVSLMIGKGPKTVCLVGKADSFPDFHSPLINTGFASSRVHLKASATTFLEAMST